MNLEHCIDASLQRHESQKAFGLSNYLCQEKVFSGRVPPSTQTRFNPWGQVAAGGISSTALNLTGQRRAALMLNDKRGDVHIQVNIAPGVFNGWPMPMVLLLLGTTRAPLLLAQCVRVRCLPRKTRRHRRHRAELYRPAAGRDRLERCGFSQGGAAPCTPAGEPRPVPQTPPAMRASITHNARCHAAVAGRAGI